MSRNKNQYKTTIICFGLAAIVYSMAAIGVLNGKFPRSVRTGSELNAGVNPRDFWLSVALQASIFLSLTGAAIYRRRLNASGERLLEGGRFFSNRAANAGAAIFIIAAGLCFLILPLAEINGGTIYGGALFGNHRVTAEPNLFGRLICFHIALSLPPIVGGVLLLLFSPPKK